MMEEKNMSRRRMLLMAGGLALALVPGAIIRALRSLREKLYPPSLPRAPRGIVIHHSATSPLRRHLENARTIDKYHRERGLGVIYKGRTYHIAYHYVILPDGTVEKGRPEKCRGGHTRSWRHNRWVGICLVGFFDPRWKEPGFHRPTSKQMDSLVDLSVRIMDTYGFGLSRLRGHGQINPTLCPGRSFPMPEYLFRVKAAAQNYKTAMATARTKRIQG